MRVAAWPWALAVVACQPNPSAPRSPSPTAARSPPAPWGCWQSEPTSSGPYTYCFDRAEITVIDANGRVDRWSVDRWQARGGQVSSWTVDPVGSSTSLTITARPGGLVLETDVGPVALGAARDESHLRRELAQLPATRRVCDQAAACEAVDAASEIPHEPGAGLVDCRARFMAASNLAALRIASGDARFRASLPAPCIPDDVRWRSRFVIEPPRPGPLVGDVVVH